MSAASRGRRVEPGQVWADPSSGARTVRILSVPAVEHGGARAVVETATPAAPGGRVGQKSGVLLETIKRRFRLVQHADGSPA